jgi:hypothetical protein
VFRILVYTDADAYGVVQAPSAILEVLHSPGVPSRENLDNADFVFVLGALKNGDQAIGAGGRLKLALEDGATVVYCYAARVSDVDRLLLDQLLPGQAEGRQLTGRAAAVADDQSLQPTFRTYFVEHGHTDYGFTTLPGEAEILAQAVLEGTGIFPTAFAARVGRGLLYVLPLHSVTGLAEPLEELVTAVAAHRDAASTSVPSFLNELHLPDEEDLLAEITRAEINMTALHERRASLGRHKLLLSHLSNSRFEELVIEELNFVLDGSGFEARDTIEQFIEDFEVVRGDVRVIGEAKALKRNVGFGNVDQLHWHRATLVAPEREDESDDEPGELPTDVAGLLVANVFRNDDDLARRSVSEVHANVARYARQMNVLILRSWDLYSLVVRRIAGKGKDDANTLAKHLQGGGGWLDVSEDEINLRR